jgi:hypothetical protein
MSPAPTFWNFLGAFRRELFALMSGGFSVPFAAAAVYYDNWPARIGFTVLALAAAAYAVFRVWHADREALIKAETELDRRAEGRRILGEIGKLRTKVSDLRIEMEQPQAVQHSPQHWNAKLLDIDKEIVRKIDELAGPGEAELYRNRGNINRRIGLPHQLTIDICIHDLDRLDKFIRTYSLKLT